MKRIRKLSLFISIIGLFATNSYGQFTTSCVEPGLADPFFQCNDPSFLPVCGCDNVTYRNECTAFRNGGVNYNLYDGVCQNDYMYAEVYPTLATDFIQLYLQFYQRSPALIQIRNTYGRTMFSQNYLSIDSRQFSIDKTGYDPGIYYVIIVSGNVSKIIKFVTL